MAQHRAPRSRSIQDMSIESILADAGGANRIVIRTLALSATAAIIGAAAFRRVVLESAHRSRVVTGEVDPLVARTGMLAAAALMVAAPWRILGQADAFMSPGDSLMPVVGLVLQTTWGTAAAVQTGAALAAFIGFSAANRAELWGWTLALGSAIVLAATPAWMGHAAATESRPMIAMGADILHVAAAGSWAGGVIVLTVVLRRLSRQANGGTLAAELISRFRPLALTGASVLLATGVISSLFRLNTPADLVESPYGVMLTAKVVLAGLAAILGRQHSLTAASRARTMGAGNVWRSIAAEASIFIVVIAVSALLSASPPPGD